MTHIEKLAADTDAGGAVNIDEANSYLELPLNNNY
tara:strand:- start:267 stop:371 length:105 start_codon:yes stop_codon:yes gene_type:complete